ncbi:2-phosphoxylose phosphatase [Enteropsectra breve]|nr:2-phosphoxylose phosphatase [Enteropsectra breve]
MKLQSMLGAFLLHEKVISNEDTLKRYKPYCGPSYKYTPAEHKLKKLIAIFRHGDRAPLKSVSKEWEKRLCKECTDGKCKNVQCNSGLLSQKGYTQAVKLGEFINKHYLSQLDASSKIDAYHTPVNRTLSTLLGVLEGMKRENTHTEEKNELILNKNNAALRDYIIKSDESVRKSSEVPVDYPVFDGYMANFCNDISVNCNSYNCETAQIDNILKLEMLGYQNLMKNFQKSFLLNSISFAPFAVELEGLMEKSSPVVLMSAHDSSISRILNGLNIKDFDIPPYAASLFIEILADKNKNDVVRISYNDEVVEFGLKKEKEMTMSDFKNYIRMFSSSEPEINKLAKQFQNNKNPDYKSYKGKILALLPNKENMLFQSQPMEGIVDLSSFRVSKSQLINANGMTGNILSSINNMLHMKLNSNLIKTKNNDSRINNILGFIDTVISEEGARKDSKLLGASLSGILGESLRPLEAKSFVVPVGSCNEYQPRVTYVPIPPQEPTVVRINPVQTGPKGCSSSCENDELLNMEEAPCARQTTCSSANQAKTCAAVKANKCEQEEDEEPECKCKEKCAKTESECDAKKPKKVCDDDDKIDTCENLKGGCETKCGKKQKYKKANACNECDED